jgi:hypothetical protein
MFMSLRLIPAQESYVARHRYSHRHRHRLAFAAMILVCTLHSGCQTKTDSQAAAANQTAITAPSNSGESLVALIDRTLEFNRDKRILTVDRNAAWQVAHGAVAYRNELKLQADGQNVPALEYLFQGGSMRGWELSTGPVLASTNRPSVQAYVEAGSYVGQGHVDQFLGYLSQASLPLSTPIRIDDQTLTIEDWGRSAQFQIPNNPYREYSWTLIALTNLFPNDYEWKAADGKTWTLEPLVEFEATPPALIVRLLPKPLFT